MSDGRAPSTVVMRRALSHPDVGPMLARLDHELVSTEPEGGQCFLTIDEHEVTDGGAFFVAYVDDVPRACGAYRRIDDHAAEVKRMWADPDTRGTGLGATVLRSIIDAATADGYTELRLETGEHLTAAVALYTRYGFTPCEPWGEYRCSPSSFCLSRPLPSRT